MEPILSSGGIIEPPPGYLWISLGQLNWLAGHSRYLNVQARTLLAVLNARAADIAYLAA